MDCEIKTQNTKSSECQFDMGLTKRVVLTPSGAKYTGLDQAGAEQTFDEWLLKGIHAKLKKDRYFPMPLCSDVVEESTEAKSKENGFGRKYRIMPGSKGFAQNYGLDYCLTKRLDSFNDGLTRGIIILDGTRAWMTEKATGKAGFQGDVFAEAAGIVTPGDVVEPKISYSIHKYNEFVNKTPVSTELDVEEIEGLEDVTMVVTIGATNTTIIFTAGCGGRDVTAEMAAITAKTACWLKDGVAVTTAPTYANGVFTIANTALTTGTKLSIADPSVLYANGVSFKECTTEALITIA